MQQEVRVIARLTFSADAELNASDLRAAIQDDIGRLHDGQEDGRVELAQFETYCVHEERDIYGNDELTRENPIELLQCMIGSLTEGFDTRVKYALDSTVDKPPVERDDPTASAFETKTIPFPDIEEIRAGLVRLGESVGRLYGMYERDGAINDVQPASFPTIFPMSLDEWAAEIGGAIEDLDPIRRYFELLRGTGFHRLKDGGAGERAVLRMDDYEIWATDMGGSGLPTPSSWTVSLYEWADASDKSDYSNLSEIWTLSSFGLDAANAAMQSEHVIHAAIATIERLQAGGAK